MVSQQAQLLGCVLKSMLVLLHRARVQTRSALITRSTTSHQETRVHAHARLDTLSRRKESVLTLMLAQRHHAMLVQLVKIIPHQMVRVDRAEAVCVTQGLLEMVSFVLLSVLPRVVLRPAVTATVHQTPP